MEKFEKCLWIVETLLRSNGLSLEDLNTEKWEQCIYSEESLTERTFSRYKEYIADCFGLDIEYSRSTNTYSIVNKGDVANNALYHYLLGAFHVRALNTLAIKHRNRVMLQDIPQGVEYLGIVLKAMDEGKTVSFFYQSYYSTEKRDKLNVIPCFVRMFEGRWYLIAEYLDRSRTWVYALERMQEVSVGSLSLHCLPENNPEDYYIGCYGIIRDEQKPALIQLKVYDQQVDYLRSLPLHHSQKEIETQEDYSIFSYYLRPSFDFMQKILWYREKVEILEPVEVRMEMKKLIENMLEKYW
jgi:predicted DNA-binding transcriptional regulator YafY